MGSLSHRKNVRCLFQAVALLSPAQQEQLVIGVVGDGEQRKELEALSKNIACEKAFLDYCQWNMYQRLWSNMMC